MSRRTWWSLGGLAALALLAVLMTVDIMPHEEYVPEPEAAVPTEDTIPDPPSAYGIPLDGFVIDQQHIKRGDTFGDLLAAHGVSYGVVDSLVNVAAGSFDVRHMHVGHPIAYVFTSDTTALLSYFVYEVDPVEHVVFHVLPPYDVRVGHRKVDTTERALSVEVTGALYNDLANAGGDPRLAMLLADIYAWTVDFYRIQKGDRFSVVFEEHTVDGQPYGDPEVLAARYISGEMTKEAYRFAQDSAMGYFDAEGNSLRKAFLQAPLKFSRISSGFSRHRFHPVQKRFKAHLGTDYAAPYGTPIHSVGDGVVEKAGYTAGNGNYVKIRHNSVYETQYLHMRKILVKLGQRVAQGQVIGEVGSTGLATGPHVCFRFWKNGVQVDHRKEELPSADPVTPAHMAAFQQERMPLAQALDGAGDRRDPTVEF
ncbi:MAG: peptidoglycan DD-metalloendopeptidase family protein [Flavobacteriales bacterium]|nr:peptidoglycan DD-metalloendopeptidase family protein [Flavobacteriales bacterium]MCB9193992.1 peptidoglycan DD-metalloendopeptidase family protein [Flavobacteriales bacterium]